MPYYSPTSWRVMMTWVSGWGAWTLGALTTGESDVEQACRLGTMAMSEVLVEEGGDAK